jgi:hypothetical protein
LNSKFVHSFLKRWTFNFVHNICCQSAGRFTSILHFNREANNDIIVSYYG